MPAIIIFITFVAMIVLLLYELKTAPYMDDAGHILPDDYDWSYHPEEVETYICYDYRWSAEELEEDDESND